MEGPPIGEDVGNAPSGAASSHLSQPLLGAETAGPQPPPRTQATSTAPHMCWAIPAVGAAWGLLLTAERARPEFGAGSGRTAD